MTARWLLVPAALMMFGVFGCGEKPPTTPPKEPAVTAGKAQTSRATASKKLPVVRYYALPG